MVIINSETFQCLGKSNNSYKQVVSTVFLLRFSYDKKGITLGSNGLPNPKQKWYKKAAPTVKQVQEKQTFISEI